MKTFNKKESLWTSQTCIIQHTKLYKFLRQVDSHIYQNYEGFVLEDSRIRKCKYLFN